MPSPVPCMKDDLNCSEFSFLSYKSFNKIFSGPVHTSRIRKFFKTKIFFEKKKKRAPAAYSSSFRLLRRKRLNNGKTIHTCPYYTGPVLYDVWHHRIRKSPFFVCPHESDKPAFPKVFLLIIIDIIQWQLKRWKETRTTRCVQCRHRKFHRNLHQCGLRCNTLFQAVKI